MPINKERKQRAEIRWLLRNGRTEELIWGWKERMAGAHMGRVADSLNGLTPGDAQFLSLSFQVWNTPSFIHSLGNPDSPTVKHKGLKLLDLGWNPHLFCLL